MIMSILCNLDSESGETLHISHQYCIHVPDKLREESLSNLHESLMSFHFVSCNLPLNSPSQVDFMLKIREALLDFCLPDLSLMLHATLRGLF